MTAKPHLVTSSGLWVPDGLVNVAAQLGTQRDKAAYSAYAYNPLGYQQLLASYRSAWIPRAIVDIPAQDATRKWRTWQAEADQISKIEKLENRLRVRETVLKGLIAARLFGGAAIYIGTGDADPSKPIDPSKVKAIRSLTVLTSNQLTPDQISRDIDGGYYGRPEFYSLTAEGKSGVKIHASRLVVLEGCPVPDVTLHTTGWGDSVLQSVMDAVLQADSANANINSLIFEAKVDVFRFQGLMETMGRGQDDLITKRLTAQATMKGINGAVILDKEDEYDQKSASFGSLPDLMDRFMQNVSGASRIPVTRLFGRSAAGLSGQGDGDERVYFDHIGHLQATEIEPALYHLDEVLIWIALRQRPEEVFYNWAPLRQISEKERADIFKTTADAARALAGTAAGELIPLDALSDALVTELSEQGVLPGLEQQIEEYGSLSEQSLEEEFDAPDAIVPPASPAEPPAIDPATGQPVADAAPRTLYVHRKVLNGASIVRWAKAQGFPSTLKAADMHVTIAFSRKPVDWIKAGSTWSDNDEGRMTIKAGGPRIVEPLGPKGAIVLHFASNDLVWRHEDIKRSTGASWDWDDFQPHITITYEGGDIDLAKVKPFTGKIELGPEVFEEVVDNWEQGRG